MSSSLRLLARLSTRQASLVHASAFKQTGISRSIYLRTPKLTNLAATKPILSKRYPQTPHQNRSTKTLFSEADCAFKRTFSSSATRKAIPNGYPGSPRGKGSKPVIQQVNFIPERQKSTVYTLAVVIGLGFAYYVVQCVHISPFAHHNINKDTLINSNITEWTQFRAGPRDRSLALHG